MVPRVGIQSPFCKLWVFGGSMLLPHESLLCYNQKSCIAVIVLTLIQKVLGKQMPGGHFTPKGNGF